MQTENTKNSKAGGLKCNWNMVGTIFVLLLFLGLEVWNIVTMIEWGDCGVWIISMVLNFVLLPIALLIYKQKFSIFQYFIVVLLTLGLCVFVRSQVESLNMYIFQKAISNDLNYLDGSAYYINDILEEWDYDTADDSSRATYDSLCRGVMITNWEEPRNDLERAIAAELYISSFEQYRYHFYTVSGQAQVYVKVTNNRTDMRLINPTPLVMKSNYVKENFNAPYLEVITSDD